MHENQNRAFYIGLYLLFSLLFLAAFVVLSVLVAPFSDFAARHPYLFGFFKFAFLATAGELISVRMATGSWRCPPYVLARWVIWGVIGIWITYMMKIFSAGVASLMLAGFLPSVSVLWLNALLRAFFISATMNLCFGPTFMAVHKCSDTYLALRAEKGKGVGLGEVIGAVDFRRFVSFTLFKTIPLFWIPAHTVTFLLPAKFQVMLAALLSVALGVILNLKKKKTVETTEGENASV